MLPFLNHASDHEMSNAAQGYNFQNYGGQVLLDHQMRFLFPAHKAASS
jgi:hypothetical protein